MAPLFLLLIGTHVYAFELSKADSKRIGNLIFQNECASQEACLVSWNKGEDFASLGIGHFIWYPKGVADSDKTFDESFPKLLNWMKTQDVEIPRWLLYQTGNPWKNKLYFDKKNGTKRAQALRQFLLGTQDLQIEFIKNRLLSALPQMLQHISAQKRQHIQQQFENITHSPMGFYVLMDYVNFKGEGIKKSERYKGKGWGLLQVLEHMQSDGSGLDAIQDFARCATFVLTRRVRLSPASRHEERWLEGWKKRLNSYFNEAKTHTFNPL